MKKIERKLVRQGDVILIPIDKVPNQGDLKLMTDKNISILAYGEVTGHMHKIESNAALLYLDEGNDKSYLETRGEVDLIHDEHFAAKLNGVYEVRIQREYTPQEILKVRD